MSVDLAKRLNTVVISADSRQFYKELSIGTAKPTNEEMQGVPHYFVDSHSVNAEISSAIFAKEAMDLINSLENEYIVLTGGSGMFIDALCLGIDNLPHDPEIKSKLIERCKSEGLENLAQELKDQDPDFAKKADLNNPARVIRALEVIQLTNKPYSQQRKGFAATRPFQSIYFVIDHERDKLYKRINQRVDQMIASGLVDEVKSVHNFRSLTSLNTVGYKEIFDFLDNKISLDEAITQIKQNTRRYAKRQLTWFRRNKDSTWISFASNEAMIAQILEKLNLE